MTPDKKEFIFALDKKEFLRTVYVSQAMKAFDKKDKDDWITALWASRIVGKYDRGATIGLADDVGVSPDTIEDRAHAYMLFERLCKLDRLTTFTARRLPYIYIAHFRALHDLQISYKLTDEQVLDLLHDVIQGEGILSSRKLEDHIKGKHGDTKDWTYYAGKAHKAIDKTVNREDLPNQPNRIGYSYDVKFSGHDEVTVIAYTPYAAEITARKMIEDGANAQLVFCTRGKAVHMDSKTLLSVAGSWLGDNS